MGKRIITKKPESREKEMKELYKMLNQFEKPVFHIENKIYQRKI